MRFIDLPNADGSRILHLNLERVKEMEQMTTPDGKNVYFVDGKEIEECQFDRIIQYIIRYDMRLYDERCERP